MKNANFIKAQMLLNDVATKDIANMFSGLSPQQVHGVIRGTRPTAYIRKAITKAVNMSEEQLWPPVLQEVGMEEMVNYTPKRYQACTWRNTLCLHPDSQYIGFGVTAEDKALL